MIIISFFAIIFLYTNVLLSCIVTLMRNENVVVFHLFFSSSTQGAAMQVQICSLSAIVIMKGTFDEQFGFHLWNVQMTYEESVLFYRSLFRMFKEGKKSTSKESGSIALVTALEDVIINIVTAIITNDY